MSKVLVLCHQGNNRSVTFAHHLKYQGFDALAAGVDVNEADTLAVLYQWADHIVTTESNQEVPSEYQDKVKLWDVGPDTYRRPFNPTLNAKARKLVALHKHELV